MILDAIIENMEAEGLLRSVPKTHVVLGFSGGRDSTVLLYLLNEIRNKRPLDITAAYFNHRWRGAPPPELPMVHQNCLKLGIPLVIIQGDLTVPKTESAARQARYRQLTRLAYDLHADAILTGHHADDQIETLLFRVFRGTGIDGLIGIQKRLELEDPEAKPVPIIRPMLDIARKHLRDYAQDNQLNYYDDPTNDEFKFQRNNIRHNILPYLEQSFPQVKNALFRLSLVAEGDLQIIEETMRGIWTEVYGKDAKGPYLEAIRFNQLGLPYQRRVLKRFLGEQNIHSDFQSIEDLLQFIRGEGRRNLDSSLKSMIKTEDGKTRFMALYKDKLRLIAGPEEPPRKEPVPVSVPGSTPVPELSLTFRSIPWQEPDKVNISPIRPADNQQVYVNLATYEDKPLELRTRRPGDKFQPMGMDVPLRFKKFLINRGVPRFERNKLLVLAHGNKVLWAPGLGISQELKIKEKTTPTHLLKLEPGIHQEEPPAAESESMTGEPVA
jgi:tRNA(Ile)-lysidine synthase